MYLGTTQDFRAIQDWNAGSFSRCMGRYVTNYTGAVLHSNNMLLLGYEVVGV